MNDRYSDLTGEYIHPTKKVVTHGAASMTTQVFAGGGLRKKLEKAHMNGYREGFEDGYQSGFEDALKAKVREYLAEALAEMKISAPKCGD